VISWSADLGEIDCPVSRCAVVPWQIAPGPDGSLWVASHLFMPGPDIFSGGRPFGAALSRFDPGGNLALTFIADFRTRLSGEAPATTGMRVSEGGHLLWIAPREGAPGVDLREYDPSGHLVGAEALLDNALSGHGAISADGSVTLAHEYVSQNLAETDGGALLADPARAARGTDVARFGGDHRLLWNQTASSILGLGRKDYLRTSVGASGQAAVNASIAADTAPQRSVLAGLDADGNLRWLKQREDTLFSGATVMPDGGVTMTFYPTFPQGADPLLVRLDASGAGVWHQSMVGWSPSPTISIPAATDGQGRLWGTYFDLGGASGVIAVAPDGARCARWTLDAPTCIALASGEMNCTDLTLAPARDGNVYFAAGTRVGLSTFGGVP
jgi:hypothetical protein